MKKIILSILLLGTTAFAQKAILVDIISENIIKVKHNGSYKKLHLAGIDLFAKANNATRMMDLDTKDKLKSKAIKYLKKYLKVGTTIKYYPLTKSNLAIQKVWLDNYELNYKMVRDGYAIVDLNDTYLPTKFKMRMTIAMNYAKEKGFGLWHNKSNNMMALIDKTKHMCGWRNTQKVQGLTRLAVIKELRDTLPNSVKEDKKFIAMDTFINSIF